MKWKRLLLCACCAGVFAPGAKAIVYSIDLWSQYTYGNLDQNSPGITVGGGGQNACGPTATVNSFTYLQNRYGLTGLIQDDPNTAASAEIDTVNNLGNAMGITQNGVTAAGFFAGKRQWINNWNANNGNQPDIVVHGMGEGADGVTPTWQFIYNELVKGQDLELGIRWLNQDGSLDGGHVITGSSFYFDDTNNDMIIGGGETATLNFVDPWGGGHHTATISMFGGAMRITYSGGAAGTGATAEIAFVAAESVVPLPAAAYTALPLLALLPLVGRLRTRSGSAN